MRIVLLATGVLLFAVVAPLVSPLPGPAGTVVAAAGLVLILRNSAWARHRFVRMKSRWPRIGAVLDRLLARASAKRRRERAKMLATN